MCYCPLGLPPHMPEPSPTSLWRRGNLLCHIAGGNKRCLFLKFNPPGAWSPSPNSRVLVLLAAKDPLVFCAAMTTSVQRYQEYGMSIWDLKKEKKGKSLIMIIQTLTSTPKVRETGCSLTSPGIIASEDSLTKDDCHRFCSGLTIGCC